MGLVDDAFDKLKTNLETTSSEEGFAQRKHTEIRDLVAASWDLEDDFLTGSYRRHTKTKPLKDVDIFVVASAEGAQGGMRDLAPDHILAALKGVLDDKYDDVKSDGFACTIKFGADEEVASFDVVPAFDRSGGGYEIPDVDRGRWIATNPKLHHEASTAMNEDCGKKFVPLVKMIKAMNREAGEPFSSSFFLEVLAQGLVATPFGSFQDEIRWFLASAMDSVEQDWPDPANVGPDVNETMTDYERSAARETLTGWLEIAEEAVRLQDEGRERAAIDEWRNLFGSRMPKS